MIVKLTPLIADTLYGEERALISENVKHWLQCVEPPTHAGVITVKIQGEEIEVKHRYIRMVINDFRDKYEGCSGCYNVQLLGDGNCSHCGRERSHGYLTPLLIKPSAERAIRRGPEEVLKGSVSNAFSI